MPLPPPHPRCNPWSATGARLAALVLALTPAVASARVAPDPLPSFQTLDRTSHQVLQYVADEVGKRIAFLNPDGVTFNEVYVWDVALVKDPSGTVRFLRLEWQSADRYYHFESTLADHPPGSVEIHALFEANGTGWVEYTDGAGVIQRAHASSIAPGAIGPGGVIVNPSLINRGGCRPVIKVSCASAWCAFMPTCAVGEVGGTCYCDEVTSLECASIRGMECINETCATDCNSFCHCQ